MLQTGRQEEHERLGALLLAKHAERGVSLLLKAAIDDQACLPRADAAPPPPPPGAGPASRGPTPLAKGGAPRTVATKAMALLRRARSLNMPSHTDTEA